MGDMTKEERQRYIAALIEERASVARSSNKQSRIDDIDRELQRMGHQAASPVKRAETRERKQPPSRESAGDEKAAADVKENF